MNVLVSVQCWQGDAERVTDALDLYTHHYTDVVVLSPKDSPVTVNGVYNVHAGLNSYNEWGAIERYRAQMLALLEFDADWYLMNESDSFCLSPTIPAAFFADLAVVRSNVTDLRYFFTSHLAVPDIEDAYRRFNPAMNAPWVMSRYALEGVLGHWDQAVDEQLDNWHDDITWVIHSAVHAAGLAHATYGYRGVCRPIENDSDIAAACAEVQRGGIMVHAVKNRRALDAVCEAYASSQRR